MPVGFTNLTGQVQGLISRGYPDIGQTYYLIDSNYRTVAQGWTRPDHTGPLDLHSERSRGDSPGYVYRTGDYGSDSLAIQAAIDAMIDFRGDTLYWTPGAYVPATVITQNVSDSRWVGSPVSHPVEARTLVTAGVAAAINVTAISRFEMAFMVWMPITTSHIFAVDTGAQYLNWHHFKYSTIGIAANAGTQFMLAAGTMNNSVFSDFYFLTDAGQGPMFELAAGLPTGIIFKDFEHLHTVGALTTSLLDIVAVGAQDILVDRGVGMVGGAAGAVTQLINVPAAMTNANSLMLSRFYGSVGYATNATIIPAAGTGTDCNIVNSYIATVGGGAGGALYIGTA